MLEKDNKHLKVKKSDDNYTDYPQKKVNYQKFKKTNIKVLDISIIIPLLNEEESIFELYTKIKEVLNSVNISNYEILFIDDGSTDNSIEIIKKINLEDENVHCIRFRRNYGKSAALAVGFKRSKGKYVITMDADLQDDPAEIPNLIQKLDEGFDLVTGGKNHRYDPISKTLPSKLFNAVTSLASGIKLHDFNCGLKAYRSDVIKTVHIYGEMHRYIPALAHW
jgi:glycosyltransferase involved in cell wall biosynthesis